MTNQPDERKALLSPQCQHDIAHEDCLECNRAMAQEYFAAYEAALLREAELRKSVKELELEIQADDEREREIREFVSAPKDKTIWDRFNQLLAAEAENERLKVALKRWAIDDSRSAEMSIRCRICLGYSTFDPQTNTAPLQHKPDCLLYEAAINPAPGGGE